jgi:hypothetical protein
MGPLRVGTLETVAVTAFQKDAKKIMAVDVYDGVSLPWIIRSVIVELELALMLNFLSMGSLASICSSLYLR